MHVKSNHTFKCFNKYLNKKLRCNIFHFKAFGMLHLHYEIRICQKIYNRVTMTVYVKCVVRFNVLKTLVKMNKKLFLNNKNDFRHITLTLKTQISRN